MIDIVGTLAQSTVSLRAILWGFAVGLICAILKLLFNSKNKVFLVVSDVIISLVFGISYIVFSLIHTKGVAWFYTLLSLFVGCLVIYFVFSFLGKKLKNILLKKNDN